MGTNPERVPKRLTVPLLALLLGACQGGQESTPPPAAPPLPIIPAPAHAERLAGTFTVDARTVVLFEGGAEAEHVAHYFADLLARTAGLKLEIRPATGESPTSGQISLRLSAGEGVPRGEGYSLTVSPQRIAVSADTPRGLFYGAVTLWQLASAHGGPVTTIAIPELKLQDAPRFAWRGLMLDVARHFMPVEFVKQMIDWMALHKLNTLHWHLTDDQGWRIEIKRYPRLTEVGAWRVPAGAAYAADIDPATGKPRLYGGYYTQDEIRDIVRYAAERYVTIVPEIEMPGHAQAAIAAYPQLGTEGAAPKVSSDWGIHTYLFNVDEDTFTFLDNVLAEVIELFPGEYVHVGGDEAAKDRWQTSPRVQARMHALGIKSEAELQGYFTRRMEDFLNAHGRKLIGWDEILEGGIPARATVMSWRGTQGGIDAAKLGHDVVMAPSPDLYMDHFQSTLASEPPGRPDPITLQDVYGYEAIPADLDQAFRKHILGAQLNFWAEHMRTPERVEHAAFPRVAAFAEAVWSAPEQRDWPGFLERLVPQLDRYRELGIAYATSAFDVAVSAKPPMGDKSRVQLGTQTGYGDIRYTLDGTDPGPTSQLYSAPFDVGLPVDLRAASFYGGERLSSVSDRHLDQISLLRRGDEELKLCAQRLPLRLEDDAPLAGARAVFRVDIMDACWIYEQAPLDDIKRVTVNVGQLPYNFQLWKDASGIVTRPPATAAGELEIRLDSCDGERLAVLSLAPARHNRALTTLSAPLPAHSGAHDLCLYFTGKTPDPLWVIDYVQLLPQ